MSLHSRRISNKATLLQVHAPTWQKPAAVAAMVGAAAGPVAPITSKTFPDASSQLAP